LNAPTILVVDDANTIRRIAERVLAQAGFTVVCAASAREALERMQSVAPDLALVDRFMPDRDGIALVHAMGGVANLASVPVVLMSERAHELEAAVRQTGAVDAISKPFGPEALLLVVTNALGRGARRPDLDSDPRARDTVPAGSEIEEHVRRLDALRRIATFVLPAVHDAGGTAVTADGLTAHLGSGPAVGELAALAASLKPLAPQRDDVSFEGRLDHVHLGDLLQMLQHQRQTGTLEIESSTEGEKARLATIGIRLGAVDLAMARVAGNEFLLGRYFVREGLVTQDDLNKLVRGRDPSDGLLGTQLLKLGYIGEEDLREALVRQTSELIYDALRWPNGRFRFLRYATRPEADLAGLQLPVAAVLMEGLRRVDEWRLIEEQVRSFDLVLKVRSDALDSLDDDKLSSEERTVLETIDGERSVREIIAVTALDSFVVCKVLFRLMTSGVAKAS
jgi:CheY-like chemotaxis protein